MNTPNTFIIGFSKCGTTALANYLNQHIDIFVHPKKEPRFFIKEIILRTSTKDPLFKSLMKESILNSKQYFESFEKRPEKILIDSSVHYVNHIEDFIQSLNQNGIDKNNIKILICVRNPVERIISNWLFLESDLLGFKESLEEEDYRMRNNYNSFWLYQHQSKYLSKIKKVQEVFPNTLIINSEWLKNNTDQTLKSIEQFLDVRTFDKYKIERKINTSNSQQFIPNFGKFNAIINRVKILNKIFRLWNQTGIFRLGIDKYSTIRDEDIQYLNETFLDEMKYIQNLNYSELHNNHN